MTENQSKLTNANKRFVSEVTIPANFLVGSELMAA
jgi:hypothetical protein